MSAAKSLRPDPYWIAVGGIALGVLVLAFFTYFAVRHHQFLAWEGERPSYDPEGVLEERVELFGRFELRIAADAERPNGDLVTSYLLFATAGATLLASLLGRTMSRTGRAQWLFLFAFLGTAYLGLDEASELHETVAANVPFLHEIPGIKRPDDLVFALNIVPGAAFVVAFRRELAAFRRALALLAAGFFGFVFAALADLGDLRFENEVEVAGALLLLAGFMALAVDLLAFGRTCPRAST